MNSRQRFIETMRLGTPDRVPYFEEGLRADVLKAWKKQGLKEWTDLSSIFQTDVREEIVIDMEPQPFPRKWPDSMSDLRAFERRFNPNDPSRLPKGWKKKLSGWQERQHVLMLRVHIGFFESMGVMGWQRFHELMLQLHKEPALLAEMMRIQGECTAAVTDKLLQEVRVDAAIFSEPIGDNNGPLISPKMYKDIVLSSYRPILDVLRRHAVEVIILRTYANCRSLIPALLDDGIGCLWACETNAEAMDYRSLRAEFGQDLKLIGGVDLDVLRKEPDDIRKEMTEKVPPLITQGGYIPLADGRVRADIPYVNYLFYRRLLERAVQGFPNL